MRRTYIDNIRWMTVVLVVIYHVIFMYNGIESTLTIGPFSDHQPQDAYQYIVYPWIMLLLFVISGMSAGFYLENHSSKEFVKSRTVKLLVPSTLGLFVFHWLQGYCGSLIGGGYPWLEGMPVPVRYLFCVVSGTGVLWYIQLLWVFSVLFIPILQIEKNRLSDLCRKTTVPVLILFAGLIFLSAQILNVPYVVVYRFGIYGTGFLLGYFVFSHDEVMERLEKRRLPLGIAAVVLAVVFTAMYWGQNYAAHEVLDTPMCNLYAWTAILAVFAWMKKYGGFENGFAGWMKAKSWGLYIFHYFYITVSAYYLRTYVPGMPVVLVYVLTTFAAFGGAYVTYEIVSRIPVIRWCVLGISKKSYADK